MNTKMMEQFKIMDTDMLASIEGGTDWGTVGKGAVYGAGIGVAMCGVGGTPYWWCHMGYDCWLCLGWS